MVERRAILPGVETYGAVLRGAPVVAARTILVPPPDSVLLKTGEYVSEAAFKGLTLSEQAYLKKRGVSAFNIEQERVRGKRVEAYGKAREFLSERERAQSEWMGENIVRVGPEGDPVLRSAFERLTPDEQRELKRFGIEDFNRRAVPEARQEELSGRDIFQRMVLAGTIPKTARFTEYAKGEIRYEVPAPEPEPITGAEAFKQLREAGKIPEGAVYKSYDEETGEVEYEVPAPKLTVQQAFLKLIDEGKIAKEATRITTQAEFERTGEIRYEVPSVVPGVVVTARGAVIAGMPSETEGEQAFNQLLIEGRIPWDSKYVGYDEKTLEVTYESPMTAPTLDYTGLEKKFLKESERYQQQTMVSAGIGTPYGIPIGIPELGLGRPGDYIDLTNEEKLRVLDAYSVLVSPVGGPSFPFPIAGVIATKVYPWTPSAAIIRLGPEASFGEQTLEAAKFTVPAVWLLDVKKMEPWQIAVNAGIDLVFLGAILGPKAVKMVTRSDIRATTKVAKVAGTAHTKMTTALVELKRTPMTSKTYPKVAARAQAATQASMKADKAFIEKLSMLKDVSPAELAKFQKFSKMPGLKSSVVSVNKAVTTLDKAWKGVEKYPMGSEKYIKGLASVEKAQSGLDNALAGFYTKTKPRYEFGRYAGWDDIITKAEREVTQAQQAANKAAAAVGKAPEVESLKLWLRDSMFDLRNAEVKLSNLKAAEAAGEFPPQYANPLWDDITKFLKKEKKPLSPEALKEALAAKERLEAKPKPYEIPRERVAVAIKEKIEVKPAIAKPRIEVKPEVKPAVKPVVPKVRPSVFPGLAIPKVRITTTTETKTADATELGRMTPEQAQRLYGSEVLVEAIGIPIPGVEIGVREWRSPAEIVEAARRAGVEWMSPSEAVKAAEKIGIEAFAKQIEQSAIEAATRAAEMNKTEAEVRAAAQEAMKTRLRTITETKLRTKVETVVRARLRTRLRTILRIPLYIPLPPGVEKVRKNEYPAGTIVWRQGAWWKIIPPPYTLRKPISSKEAPAGVTVMKGTPQETLTFTEGVVPFENVAFDLGVVDGYIDVRSKIIVYGGHGLKTDVGRRIPGPTKGLSLEEAEALGIELPKTRRVKRKVPKRRAEPSPGIIDLGRIEIL